MTTIEQAVAALATAAADDERYLTALQWVLAEECRVQLIDLPPQELRAWLYHCSHIPFSSLEPDDLADLAFDSLNDENSSEEIEERLAEIARQVRQFMDHNKESS